MGWYNTLEVECKVLPEFSYFFEREYLREISEYDDIYTHEYCKECLKSTNNDNCLEGGRCDIRDNYKQLSKAYLDLLDIWTNFHLGSNFYEYDFNKETNVLKFNITAKVTTYHGYLKDDYMTILHDIIVPTTSEIIFCCISSDDYCNERRYYTDTELRRIPFSLSNVVRNIRHKWEDGMIVETTVIYKRSIKKTQELDLDRCYGFEKI